jgi:hypothetical protein
VKFFNASISGRREEGVARASEGVARASEGDRNTRGGSWFSCRGVTEECSGAAADSRSGAASGWTRGEGQPIGPKGRLGWILLWRSNKLPKWNGLGKRDSWAEKKIMEN